ncbi:MAG TPA: peptidylprolyl isomerase [Pyrinomonadaceae bacterium]
MAEGQRVCPACGTDVAEAPQAGAAQTTGGQVQKQTVQPVRKSPYAPTGGVNPTLKALIAAGVAILFAAGLVFWQVKAGTGVDISSDDLVKLVETFPEQEQAVYSRNKEARQELAKELRELLAVAEEARAAGIADRPEVQRQLALSRAIVIGQTYIEKQNKEAPAGASSFVSITQADVDAFLKEPGQEQKFEEVIADIKARSQTGTDIPPERKQQFKQQWAEFMIAERRGLQQGLDKDRKVQLQLMLQEARVLASYYAREHLAPRIKATDAEVDAYVAKIRGKAEDVLRRARAGEDFSKLAAEFSTDPGSKTRGGDLGWFGRGQMIKPFEDAAFGLQPGQISDIVETEFGYHIIKVDERGMRPGEGGEEEQVHARHILIGYGIEQADPMAPPLPPREQARRAAEQDKQKKIIDELVARSRVKVAEDFDFKLSDSAGGKER